MPRTSYTPEFVVCFFNLSSARFQGVLSRRAFKEATKPGCRRRSVRAASLPREASPRSTGTKGRSNVSRHHWNFCRLLVAVLHHRHCSPVLRRSLPIGHTATGAKRHIVARIRKQSCQSAHIYRLQSGLPAGISAPAAARSGASCRWRGWRSGGWYCNGCRPARRVRRQIDWWQRGFVAAGRDHAHRRPVFGRHSLISCPFAVDLWVKIIARFNVSIVLAQFGLSYRLRSDGCATERAR